MLPDVEDEPLPLDSPPLEDPPDELPAVGAFGVAGPALLLSAVDDDDPLSEFEEAAELELEPDAADAFLALPL